MSFVCWVSMWRLSDALPACFRRQRWQFEYPAYVRGKAVSDEKGEYAADGFKNALMTWEASSQQLNIAIAELLQRLK